MSRRLLGFVVGGVLVVAVAVSVLIWGLNGDSGTSKTSAPTAAGATGSAAAGAASGGSTATGEVKGQIPTKGQTMVSNADAVTAACNVSPAKLKVLTRISTDESALENLRDGIPLLDERIDDLQDAADGRPVLNAVVEDTQRLRADWNDALDAHDNGHAAAAKKYLGAANREITEINKLLTSSAEVPASKCA